VQTLVLKKEIANECPRQDLNPGLPQLALAASFSLIQYSAQTVCSDLLSLSGHGPPSTVGVCFYKQQSL
jgi:hypothetical protein